MIPLSASFENLDIFEGEGVGRTDHRRQSSPILAIRVGIWPSSWDLNPCAVELSYWGHGVKRAPLKG